MSNEPDGQQDSVSCDAQKKLRSAFTFHERAALLSFVKVHGFHEVSMSLLTLGSLAMFVLVSMINASLVVGTPNGSLFPIGAAFSILFAVFFFCGIYFLQHVRRERIKLIRSLKKDGLDKELAMLGLAGRSDVVLLLPGVGLPFGEV